MSAIWLAPALNNLTVVRIKIYLTYTESLPALSGTRPQDEKGKKRGGLIKKA
ncbi:hypothetical protein Pan153_15720 [Gimesia panareensis]|uniref:Uncharacterized protein n=1 Tax=Gimesia panareensis TaxID=2527978 RepID=A0A518FKR0_9PLAN|nr:hypothetical protein Pan153_15720 [Gimesia panareensis]